MNSRIAHIRSREAWLIIILLMLFVGRFDAYADSIPEMKDIKGRIQLLDEKTPVYSPDTLMAHTVTHNLPVPSRIASQINIYDMPYSLDASYRNWNRLWLNTGVLCGAGVVALGVLESLPEDATNWNRAELSGVPPFKRWGNHVAKVAHWDGDSPIFNYVLHPYGGAAYFMSARSQGFNFWESSLYCFCVSTFFWEYGIEAFMEVPSIQDIVITPVVGSILGECFYKWKRSIVANGYTLCGSSILGNAVAFLIDPVNEVIGLFAGNPCRQNLQAKRSTEIVLTPIIAPSSGGKTRSGGFLSGSGSPTYGFTLHITL